MVFPAVAVYVPATHASHERSDDAVPATYPVPARQSTLLCSLHAEKSVCSEYSIAASQGTHEVSAFAVPA